MAEQVEFQLTANAQPLLASLDAVEASLKGIQTESKKAQTAAKELFAPATESALAEVEAIEKLQKEYKDLEKASATLRSALDRAADPRAISKYATELAKAEAGLTKLRTVANDAGVKLKGIGTEAQKASVGVKQLEKSSSTASEVVSGLFGAFTKATIILAVVQAVVEFTKELVGFSASIQKAEKQFENFTGSAESAEKTVAGLVDLANKKFLNTQEVLDSGKALLAFGEAGDNLEVVLSRIADISSATGKNFQELTTIYGKARAAGVLYAEDINQLVDAGIPIIGEFAKQLGVSEGEVKKLASEGKISFEELQLAFFNLTEAGGTFAGQAEAQAKTLGGAWRSLSSSFLTLFKPIGDFLSETLTGALRQASFELKVLQNLIDGLSFAESVAQANEEVFGITNVFRVAQDEVDAFQKELITGQKEQQKNILFINKERQKLEKEAADKRIELEKGANAKLAEQRRKEAEKLAAEEARNAQQRAQLRAELTADETEKQIQLEQLKYNALTAELRKYFKDGEELNGLLLRAEQDFNDATNKIRAEALLAQLELQNDLEQQRQEELQAIANASTDQVLALRKEAEENAKARQQIALSQIDLAKAQGEALIIELKKAGASEEQIRKAQAELDSADKVARLTAELEFQQALLQITSEADTERRAQIETSIATIQQEIQNAVDGLQVDGGKGKGLFSGLIESLGLSDSDLDTLKQSAAQLVGAISQITAARLADADAAVQASEKSVQAAEDALDREIALAEAGFASNVEFQEAALEQAKKTEAEALAEKKKAQKAQLALDAATQASSIATSAANLIASWSTLPLGVGLIAAFAQVATLFAFLGSVRAKAKAATQFGEGGEASVSSDSIVAGPSHANGGVGIEVEGGEFMTSDGKKISIVKKHMTKKHFALLRAINEDNTPEIGRIASQISAGAANLPTLDVGAGERVSSGVASSVALRRDKEAEAMKEQNALLRENNRLLRGIRDKEVSSWEQGGYRYEKRGNKTTVTRK